MPTEAGFAASYEMVKEIEQNSLTNQQIVDLLEELEQSESDNSVEGRVDVLTAALRVAFRRIEELQAKIDAK